jgi:hypothetical protein
LGFAAFLQHLRSCECCLVQDSGTQMSASSAFGGGNAVVQAQSSDPVTGPGGGAVVSDGLPQPAGNAVYNASADALTITGIGYQILCPDGIRITWQGTGSSPSSGTAG